MHFVNPLRHLRCGIVGYHHLFGTDSYLVVFVRYHKITLDLGNKKSNRHITIAICLLLLFCYQSGLQVLWPQSGTPVGFGSFACHIKHFINFVRQFSNGIIGCHHLFCLYVCLDLACNYQRFFALNCFLFLFRHF